HGGKDGHAPAAALVALEANATLHEREEGVIPSHADVPVRMDARAALPHENRAGGDQLPVSYLHAQPLGLAVATVARAAARLLVRHDSSLRGACSVEGGHAPPARGIRR